MKPKSKPIKINSECMLTVRLPRAMLLSITKVSTRVAMTRSDFVRTILQKSLDSNPLSYKV